MAYALTSQPIAHALIAAHQRGVKVIVVADKSQIGNSRSQIKNLALAGISIYIDYRPKIQHNKIMIIDRKTVIGGSYNWSDSAENKNAENLMIINNPQIANQYLVNFEKRKKASRPIMDMPLPKPRQKAKTRTL